MYVQTDVIDAYMQERKIPDKNAWFYQYTNGCHIVFDNRQEVCQALLSECKRYDAFPLWNSTLAHALHIDACDDIILYPVIGTQPSFDCRIVHHHQKTYLLVDLLHIADHTKTLKQMCYVLHHLCHQNLFKEKLYAMYPKPNTFHEQLSLRFFVEGIALYLSWNENHGSYVFQSKQYDTKKERAFVLLFQAYEVKETSLQNMILQGLKHSDLWSRFPDIAGMFYLDDLYQEQGDKGIRLYFEQGIDQLFQRIFD